MRVSVVVTMVALCSLYSLCSWAYSAAPVRADQVRLVGGAELEGKATRHGDKIVVEMESGQITLSADGVENIERGPSTVQRFDERVSKLKPGDVQGRLALADFCRDHDMRAREKELLRQVIELDSDQAQARARLGYVKVGGSWITRDEQLRAQGFVQKDGQWVTQERALELERLRAQSDAAVKERDKAQAELESKRLELQQRRVELEAQQAAAHAASAPPAAPVYYSPYGYSYGYAPAVRGERPSAAPTRQFPISGVRDPRDTSWPLNGVRDPRSY